MSSGKNLSRFTPESCRMIETSSLARRRPLDRDAARSGARWCAGLAGYRWSMGAWGTGSFENDAASDWFYIVEEAVEPGLVIAAALDDALAEAGYLELDSACAAIAGAELLASCAGVPADHLPDHIRRWVTEHPHQPYDAEIDQAVQAVQRVRGESELRELWDEGMGPNNAWLAAVDDLLTRLRRSGTDAPAALRP